MHYHSMAWQCTSYAFSPSSPSPHRDCWPSSISTANSSSRLKSPKPSSSYSTSPVPLSSFANTSRSRSRSRSPSSYNTLVFQAVRLLGPPARFEASKLKVILMEQETNKYERIVPRTYTLSHCDFTANLTLTISNAIQLDQLKGWYSKDDVVAEWKEVNGDMYLDIHCYVSGPNLLLELAAEFRYHIFSKEMPLVLQAVMHGDSLLFTEHKELMDAFVRVYFHSCSKKYNRVECWGQLKDAVQGRQGDQSSGLLNGGIEDAQPRKIWGSPKLIFQAFVAFLL